MKSAKLHLLLLSLMLLLLTTPVLAQDATAEAPPPDDAPYKNASLPVEDRVNDLLSRMTVEEKIGQMTLVEKNSIDADDITSLYIGALLSGGGGHPANNTVEAWADMVNGFQQKALATRLGIPLIYGADGVHGHNNLKGATIFPQEVGMGATRDPDLLQKVCNATAQEMMATGVYWNYAPVVAVPQDIRWGRTYEGYGENTDLVSQMATACITGMQTGSPFVMATPKHFVGDGGTAWGSSTTGTYEIDQGVTEVDEATLDAIHLPPYIAAIKAGALSIMASFSSCGGSKMSAQHHLLTDVLKGQLGFQGFVVSDWQAIDQIGPDYYQDVVTAINAGIDMNMVPQNYVQFIDTMQKALDQGDISMDRLNDAVRRILRAKFTLGLFEHPMSDADLVGQVGSPDHRALAEQAVSESLVLLKNDASALPLAKDAPTIFIGGNAANDIGLQSGGWTIEWQGGTGAITPGTTITDAIKAKVSSSTQVKYNRFGKFDNVLDASGNPVVADVGIAVVGEAPYAEGVGDNGKLALSDSDKALIQRMRQNSRKLIVIIISGRPLIITDIMDSADAVIAAWLPGTEGEGVADDLFGDKPFVGKLPYTWPRSIDQIPFDFKNLPTSGDASPLFPYGYGLTIGS